MGDGHVSLLGSDLPTADPYLVAHGDPSWSATHYDLDLSYDIAANSLRGEAAISCVAETDLDRVVLDLAHLGVAKVTVDGQRPAKWWQRGDRLVLRLQHRVFAGEAFFLTVKYAGHPRPVIDRHHGDAGWEELSDGVIVAAQPHGSPTWFPCNDRPDNKATYSITVTTQPQYVVVANGLLTERRQGAGSVAWRYELPEPMATYLATVQIGRYEVREQQATIPMRCIVPADATGVDETFGRQPEMLETFEQLFGPYPFASYAAVVTSDDLEIPLESQSLSTFGSNFLTGEWRHVRLVAHELAHQWFGNAVTLREWRHIWLHEGFACYAEWLWSEASGAESADAWAEHHHERLTGLDQDLVLADPGPELMFDDRVYKRGALTLHALRRAIGDDLFFTLLRTWVDRHRGGSVVTADFVALAEEVSGSDLSGFFAAWLEETALPPLVR